MGRSAVLATVSWTVRRPSFATMSPSPRMYSPGITSQPPTVDCHVGECGGPPGEPQPRARRANPISQAPADKWMNEARVHSSDWVMYGHELGAVGKGAFDLHLLEHLGHAVHDIAAIENGDAEGHEVGDAPAIADALQDLGGDQGQGLWIVQLEPPPPPPAGHLRRGEDQQLVLLSGGQVHGRG